MATDIFTELQSADDNRTLALIDLARNALLYDDRSSSSLSTTPTVTEDYAVRTSISSASSNDRSKNNYTMNDTTNVPDTSKDTGRILIQDENRFFRILQERLTITDQHKITEELLLGILQYYVTVIHTIANGSNDNPKYRKQGSRDVVFYIMDVLPSIIGHLGYKNPYVIIESSTHDRIRRGIGVLILAVLQYHYSTTYGDITKCLVTYGIESSMDLLSKDTIILCGDIIRNYSSNINISMVFDWSILLPSIAHRLYQWDQQILHESVPETITLLRQCVTTSEKTLGKIHSVLQSKIFNQYFQSLSSATTTEIIEAINLHMDNIIQYSVANSKKLASPSSAISPSTIKSVALNNREMEESESKTFDESSSSSAFHKANNTSLPSHATPVRTSGFLHRTIDSNTSISPLMATAEELSSNPPSFTNVSSPTTLSSLVPPNVMQKLRKSLDTTSVESVEHTNASQGYPSSTDNEDPTILNAIAERTAAGEQLFTRVLGLSTRTALNLFTNREGQALQELFTLSCSLIRDDTSMRICVIGLGVLDRILYLCGQLGIVNESITLSKSNNRISIEWEEDVWPTIADRLGDDRALIRHAAVKACVSLIWARSLLTSLSSVLGLLKHRNKQTRESAVRVLLHAILQHAALRYENTSSESIHIILSQDIRRMIVAIAPLINDTAGRVATVSIEFLSALNTYVAGQDPSQQGIGKLNPAFIEMIQEAGIDTSSSEWFSVTSRIELMPSTVPRINTSGYLELPAENASTTAAMGVNSIRTSLIDKYNHVSPSKENYKSSPSIDSEENYSYSSSTRRGTKYPSVGLPGQQNNPVSTQHGPRIISTELSNENSYPNDDHGLLKLASFRSMNGTAATPTSVESISVHDTPSYPGTLSNRAGLMNGSAGTGSGKSTKGNNRKGGHTPINNEYFDQDNSDNVPHSTLSFMGKLSQALQDNGNRQGLDEETEQYTSSSPKKGKQKKRDSPARSTDTLSNPHLTVEILENMRQNRVPVGELHLLGTLNASNRSIKSTDASTKNGTPEGMNRVSKTSPRKEYNNDPHTDNEPTEFSREQSTPRRKKSYPQLIASPMVTNSSSDVGTNNSGTGKGYAARHLAQKNLKNPSSLSVSSSKDRINDEESKYNDPEFRAHDNTNFSPSLRSVSANKVSPSKASHSKYLSEKLEQIYSPTLPKTKSTVQMHNGAYTTSVVTRTKTRLTDDSENEINQSLDIPQIATHLNFQEDAKLPTRSPIHSGMLATDKSKGVRTGGSVSASYNRENKQATMDVSLDSSIKAPVDDDAESFPVIDAEEAKAVQSKLDLLKRRSRQTSRLRRTASALPVTNSAQTGSSSNDKSILNSSIDSSVSMEQESKEIESIHSLLRHRENDEYGRIMAPNSTDTLKKSSSLVSASSVSSTEGKSSDNLRSNRSSNGGSGNYLNYRDRLPSSGTSTTNNPSVIPSNNKISSINLKRGPAGSYDSVALSEEFGWDPYAGQPASPAKVLRNTGGNMYDAPLGIAPMGLRSGGSAHSDLSDTMLTTETTATTINSMVGNGLPGIRTKALSGGNVRSMMGTNESSLSQMSTIVNQYSFEVQSPPTNEGIILNKKAFSAGTYHSSDRKQDSSSSSTGNRSNGLNALPPLSSTPTNIGTNTTTATIGGLGVNSYAASPIDTPRSLSSHATQNGESGIVVSSNNGTDQDSERLSSLSMGEVVPVSGSSTTPSSISGPLGPLRLLSSRMTRSGSRKPQINTEPGMIGTGSGITPRNNNNTDRNRASSGNTKQNYARSENSLSPVSMNSTSDNGPDTGFTVTHSGYSNNHSSSSSSSNHNQAPLSPSPSDERPIRPMANAEAFYRTLAAQGDEVKDSVLSLTAGFVSPVDINIYTNAENMKSQNSETSVIKLISPSSPQSRGMPQFVNHRSNVQSSSSGARSPVRPRSIHPFTNNNGMMNDSEISSSSVAILQHNNDNNSIDGDNYQDNSLNNSTNDDNASIGSYGDMNYSDTASVATSGSYTHSIPSNNGNYYRKRRTVNKLPSINSNTNNTESKDNMNIAGLSGTGYANINSNGNVSSSTLNTSTGSALSGVPSGAPNTEKLYIPTSQLSPLLNPDSAVKTALSIDLLPDSNWEKQFEACNTLRRGAIFHPDSLLPILHSCVMSLLPLCDSLRSSVSKIALMTLADFFRGVGRSMDPELENLLPSVLRRAADTNEFILVAAEEALTNMIMYCSDNRSVSSLLGCATHKNTSIRLKTAIWLDRAMDHAGMKLSGNRDLERIVTIAVKFSQEGLQEVRHSGTRILHRLMKTNVIDERFLSRCGVSERILTKLRESFQRGVPDDPMPLGSSGLSIGIPVNGSMGVGETDNYASFSNESTNENFSMRSTSPKAFTSMAQKKRMNNNNNYTTNNVSGSNESKENEYSLRNKSRSQSAIRGTNTLTGNNNTNDGSTPRSEGLVTPNGNNLNGGVGGGMAAVRAKSRMRAGPSVNSSTEAFSNIDDGSSSTPNQGAEVINGILTKLIHATDWNDRVNGLKELVLSIKQYQSILSSPTIAISIADELGQRLNDNNNKVLLTALQSTQAIIPLFSNDIIDRVALVLLPTLANNLLNNQRTISQLSSGIIDTLISMNDPTPLLLPMVNIVRNNNYKLKSAMLEKLTMIIPLIYSRRGPSLLVRTILPAIFELLDDPKPDIKNNVQEVLNQLTQAVGAESLMEAARSSSLSDKHAEKLRMIIGKR